MTMLIGNAILIAATIPAVLFVVLYSRVHWERTGVGRQNMAMSVSMALILLNSVAAIVFRNYPGRSIVRLVIFSTIAPVLWWRVALIIRAQREVRYTRVSQGKGSDDDALRP